MAVTDTDSHQHIPRFFGLSTDTKPTGVPVASTFTETDTQEEFVYDGASWARDKTVVVDPIVTKTAFGEQSVAEPTPAVQLQFPYNINTDLVEKRENNAGSITQSGSMAVMQSGASANSAAHMLSRIPLKYNPGQGALVRFTALFTTGVANSIQVAGIGEVGDGLFFGYNGATFSILRREKGVPEIQTLTISAGAGSSSGNITINLDGVSKVVAVALNDTARAVAVKIADTDFSCGVI